jgi:hypothetical protein
VVEAEAAHLLDIVITTNATLGVVAIHGRVATPALRVVHLLHGHTPHGELHLLTGTGMKMTMKERSVVNAVLVLDVSTTIALNGHATHHHRHHARQ